jgi:hypothetical protein
MILNSREYIDVLFKKALELEMNFGTSISIDIIENAWKKVSNLDLRKTSGKIEVLLALSILSSNTWCESDIAFDFASIDLIRFWKRNTFYNEDDEKYLDMTIERKNFHALLHFIDENQAKYITMKEDFKTKLNYLYEQLLESQVII